jgi:hypothetical protein
MRLRRRSERDICFLKVIFTGLAANATSGKPGVTMTVDPNERLARLEERMRELEGLIRGCKTDIKVLLAGLVFVFLAGSRLFHAVLASLGVDWGAP